METMKEGIEKLESELFQKEQAAMREKVHLLISVKFRLENGALPSIYSEPATISISRK